MHLLRRHERLRAKAQFEPGGRVQLREAIERRFPVPLHVESRHAIEKRMPATGNGVKRGETFMANRHDHLLHRQFAIITAPSSSAQAGARKSSRVLRSTKAAFSPAMPSMVAASRKSASRGSAKWAAALSVDASKKHGAAGARRAGSSARPSNWLVSTLRVS